MIENKVLKECSELIDEYRKYDLVIIYGYKGIGETVQEYFMYNYNTMRSSAYNCKVKYFATSFKNYEVSEGTREVKGVPIHYIGDLQEYSDEALVIVATRESDQDDVLNILNEFHFKNVVCVSKQLYTKLKIENRKISGELRLEVMQYSLNHQIKLEFLREKVSRNEKINVVFMSHTVATFGCKSLYDALEKSPIFIPYIMPFERKEKVFSNWKELLEENCNCFKSQGYRVLDAYDGDYLVDMEKYNADIIFIDYPNFFSKGATTQVINDVLSWKYLTCYVPYGCLMANSFYYHYEAINTRKFWKFFLDTRYSFKRSISEADFNGGNTVLSGYPKLDEYFIENNTSNIPEKLKNGKPIVIYAPHWSIGMSNNYATFNLYNNIFLELAKNNPDINFVFKPHPLLESRIHRLNEQKKVNLQIYEKYKDLMTYKEYIQYVSTWENLPNGIVITGGDYIELFKMSSCMITDSGSFIGEYLLSGRPCIYLINPDKPRPFEGYTEVAQKILHQYYLCYNEEEIISSFNEVVLNGNDYKSEGRKKVIESDFVNLGCAGKFICEYLEKELKG